MHNYLHNNIIYRILVARNHCRETRRKFSTIWAKADKSVRKIYAED
jgi:hypothetical protein